MKTRKQQVTMSKGNKIEPWALEGVQNSEATMENCKFLWHFKTELWWFAKMGVASNCPPNSHIYNHRLVQLSASSEKFLSAVDGGWCRKLTAGQSPKNKCQGNARYKWEICVEFPLHKVQRNLCRRWGRKVVRHWWGGLEQNCIFWSLWD